MSIREFENAVHRIILRCGWRVQRAGPAPHGWEAGRAYWDAAYIRRLGFRPQTIVDVGVGHGTPDLYEAFPEAQLVLVEPVEEFFQGVAEILARRPGVHIPAAAWSCEGEVEMRVKPHFMEGSSHYCNPRSDGSIQPYTPRTVPATTIDRIIADHAFPEPFGLKIDTEGAELEIIRGAAAALERTEFVIAEVGVLHNRYAGSYSFAEFISAMDQAGFEVCDLLGIGRTDSSLVDFVDLVFRRSADGSRITSSF